MSHRSLAVLLASFFLSIATLSAQTVTGSITGVIEDPHGSVIPSVDVKLISQSTGATRNQTTDQRGEFTFDAIPPDIYTVSVEHSGFKKYEQKDLVLNPSDHLSTGQIKLQIGAATESVEVIAEGAAVQTASSERSGVITSEQVQDLTVINRDFTVLASLQPGVAYSPGAEAQSFSGSSQFNVNGGRAGQNNITIDGIPIENSNGTGINTFISMDAVSQVKVQSSGYQAEFGRKAGAAIQAVTKAGGQQYHGEVYWLQRNNLFNAKPSFSKTNGLPDPEYHFITAGANLGGPVYIPKLIPRDQKKLFFFVSEEQQREVRPQDVQQVTVPTALERIGNFSQSGTGGTPLAIANPAKTGTCKKVTDAACFPGGIIPTSSMDPRTLAYLNLFPLPNAPQGGTQYNYQVQEALQIPKHTETLRLDYNATSKTSFYTVLNRWWDDERGFAVPAGNAKWGWLPSEYNPIARTINISGTHIFSPTLIFEGTVLGSRWTEGDNPKKQFLDARNRALTGATLPQLDPQNNPLNLVPQSKFGGITNSANPTIEDRFPISGTENIFSFQPVLTNVRGPHTLKTGMYIEYWQQVKAPNGNFTGTYDFSADSSQYTAALGNTGNAWANALVGDFNNYTESTTRPPLLSKYTGLEWFAQDNWKITRNLTLDLGLRVGWSRPFHDPKGDEAGFSSAFFNPAQQVQLYGAPGAPAPPNVGLSGAIVNSNLNPNAIPNGTVNSVLVPGYPPGLRNSGHVEFGPRFGFSYDPFGDGKTAIRGGFGMFYDFRERDNFFTNIFKDPPIQFNPKIEFGKGINTVNPAILNAYQFPSSTNSFVRNRKVPYVMDYSFGIQREIGFKTVVDIAYVASLARNLIWKVNLNPGFAGATGNPANKGIPSDFFRPFVGYTDITQFQYNGTSNYNSLQVAVNRRFTKSFDFGIAYTWSKAFDFADSENSEVLNPLVFNNFSFRAANYGRANYDHNHIFKASWTWDLPSASRLWDKGFVRGFLDNWALSGITSYQTGAPDPLQLDNVCLLAAPTLAGSVSGCPSANRISSNSGKAWIGSVSQAGRVVVLPGSANNVTTPFAHVQGLNNVTLAPPLQGVFGLGPRVYYNGPGLADWDMALFKQFPLGGSERFKLRFRAEAYDLFNHTNFKDLTTSETGTKAQFQVDYLGHFVQTNSSLGRYAAAQPKRRMQLGLQLTF